MSKLYRDYNVRNIIQGLNDDKIMQLPVLQQIIMHLLMTII